MGHTVSEVRQKYLEFFKSKGHVIVPSSSLVPENDPTTLFTGSGMQPMVPYLLGEKHPAGKRIADSQKCFRSQDIEEVGDNRHTTFFEMLGNWSLGDYWKQEQLSWIFAFLTKEVGIPKEKLSVTCFEGDEKLGIPRDTESAEIWESLGIPKGRIHFYGAKKNWWSRAGVPENMPVGEPGGADSEIFYEFTEILHDPAFGERCHPNCDCGRFMEIGNSVFMEYRKTETGFEKLPQRNVDFGGGLERITAASNDDFDVFKIDIFAKVIDFLEHVSGKNYSEDPQSFRIIADHTRAVTFAVADGIAPSKSDRGSLIRKMFKRVFKRMTILNIDTVSMGQVIRILGEFYPELQPNLAHILEVKAEERKLFGETEIRNNKLLEAFDKYLKGQGKSPMKVTAIKPDGSYDFSHPFISAEEAFKLYATYGISVEDIEFFASQRKYVLNKEGLNDEIAKHRKISQGGIEKKFKGGLADTSEKSVKYHTATHLLHQALRDVLGDEVGQKGSNITPERLRFDFSFGRKMTDEEKKKVEDMVNAKIQAKLPMQRVVMPRAEAEKSGALHFFGEKYGDEVSVYFIGDSLSTAYSKEFCGGPHVTNTGVLGTFKIQKEEAVSAGVRRIKAVLS